MHELGIAQSILDIALKAAGENGGTKVTAVRIQAGELRSIIADQLEFCFAFAAKGTAAEGAKLEVEVLPIIAVCGPCEREFRVENLDFRCPVCQGTSVRVVRGQELRIREIEIC